MIDNRIENELHAVVTVSFQACVIIVEDVACRAPIASRRQFTFEYHRVDGALVSEPGVALCGDAMIGQSSCLNICDVYQPMRFEVSGNMAIVGCR